MGIAVNDCKVTDCIAKVSLVGRLNSRTDNGVSSDTLACLFMGRTLLFVPLEIVWTVFYLSPLAGRSDNRVTIDTVTCLSNHMGTVSNTEEIDNQ